MRTRALRVVFLLLLGALAAGLAGCSHRTAVREDVDLRMVLPPPADRMMMKEDQTFFMPSPIDNPMPAFPDGYAHVEGAPPIVVCVDIVVSEEGEVVSLDSSRAAPECVDVLVAPGSSFFAKVLEAVGGWSFFAAGICEHPPGAASACDSEDAVVEPVAVRLSYEFSFSSREEPVGVRSRLATP